MRTINRGDCEAFLFIVNKNKSVKFVLCAAAHAPTIDHRPNDDGEETSWWTLGLFNPAGGLKSDIIDMAAYVRANMKEINKDFALSHQLTFTDERYSIGLNWIISITKDKRTMIWHNGETGGFHSFAGYVKDANMGIVILSNSQQDIDNIATTILAKMAASQ